jgi:hypothetical protein
MIVVGLRFKAENYNFNPDKQTQVGLYVVVETLFISFKIGPEAVAENFMICLSLPVWQIS